MATWQDRQCSVFHSASGTEVLRFRCPYMITEVTLSRNATELFATHERGTITRLALSGQELPEIVSAVPAAPPLPPPPSSAKRPPAATAAATAGTQPLVAQSEAPGLLARGANLLVTTPRGVLLIDPAQETAASFTLPNSREANFSESAGRCLFPR